MLCFLFILPAFADKKKKTENIQELDEKTRLEFDYSFMEGVRSKITGDYQAAIGWFDNCLKILPSSSVAKYEIAGILTAGEDYNGALQLAREAVAGNPDNMWYKILLANILQKKAMIEEACNVYADIIAKYPNKEEFYLIEAELYISVEKWQKAIEVFDRYEQQNGITEPVSIEKIKLYTKLDDVKKASNELLKLIRKFPDKSEYLSLLAELYFNYNQDKKGLQILDRILKAEPDNGFVHFYLADYYRSKKELKEADRHTKEALVSDKIENGYKIQYILKLILNPDTTLTSDSQLDNYMNLLMQKYSDDLSVRALHSDFLKKDHKLAEARNELEYILSKDKNNYLIWEELLLMCNEMGDTTCMYRHGIEAIKYFPEQPLPYALSGIALMMQKQFAEALPLFEKGVELTDDKPELRSQFYSYLADCYYNLDSVERAFKMFDEVLKINPNDILVLNNYAYYLSLRNERLALAEKMSSQAVAMESDNATYLDTYAWVLYKRGEYSQARYYIKLAIEKDKDPSGVLYEHYGDILYRSGEHQEALKMWKKAASVMLASAMVVSLAACGSSSNKAESSSEGGSASDKTYIIATDTTFAPFEFTNDKNEFVGIDVDILAAIAKDQGFKYDLQSLGFDAAVAALESGQADGTIAGMSITEERQKKYDFSEAYYDSYVCMAVKKGSNIKGYEDLKGKKVAAKTGTQGADCAESLKDKYGFDITYFDDSATMYQDVKTGNTVACFEDQPVMAYGVSQGNGLEIVAEEKDNFSTPYGFAVLKGQNADLLKMFNEGLKNIKANGTYDEIVAKYTSAK